MTWTKQAASFVTSLKYEDIPDEVVETAKRAVLDTIACMIAGSNQDVVKIMLNQLVGEKSDKGISTILTQNCKTSPVNAAFVNGVMGHALDFDDVNTPTYGHPSTVMVPAALAAAEAGEIDGKEFIVSYVVGVEIMSALGDILGFSHYKKGWHTTTTLGTIGATASACRALSLNEDQVIRALAIAVSQTSGSRENFGTHVKPFHAGNAARIGVFSALLAKDGMTASDSILDAKMGYFNLFAGEQEINKEFGNQVFNSLGKDFKLLNPGICVKKYPCCYWTARAADGMIDIAVEEQLTAEDIAKIEVVSPTGELAALIYDRPVTGLQGKFSMEYVISAALIDKKLQFRTFEDDYVQRPEVMVLEEKVMKSEDPNQNAADGVLAGYVSVKVITKDGREIQKSVEKPRGSADRPLTIQELKEKLEDCLQYGKKPHLDSEKIVSQVLILDKVENIRPWLEQFQ